MQAEETINTYLSLIGQPAIAADTLIAHLPTMNLHQAWEVFQQFIHRPLTCVREGFIFEASLSPELPSLGLQSKFYIVMRRYFFLPLDDDPDRLYQLSFECTLAYPPEPDYAPFVTWFQVEVADDLTDAATTFIRQVEAQQELWHRLGTVEPDEATLFQ